MAEELQQVRETTTQKGSTVEKTTEVNDPHAEKVHGQNMAERLVWLIAGVLLTLLGFRLLFVMLGANPANNFAQFIYNSSEPLVSPFFNLFSVNSYNYGTARIEIFTLVAMLFYVLLAWGVAKLVTLNRN